MATAQAAISSTVEDGFIRRGDFTKERHELPERSEDEVWADVMRLQAEHPERLTIKPTR